MKGTVKWFHPEKGFGFVHGDDGKDYFVHFKEIKGDGFKVLNEGEGVSFDPTVGKKGPLAMNVVKNLKD